MRAWARENGIAVAERGRLPAEVHAAFVAAQGSAAKPARKAAKAPSKATSKATAKATKRTPAAPAAEADAGPSLDLARLTALEEQVQALVARVATLEQAPVPAVPAQRPSRFRRRNG